MVRHSPEAEQWIMEWLATDEAGPLTRVVRRNQQQEWPSDPTEIDPAIARQIREHEEFLRRQRQQQGAGMIQGIFGGGGGFSLPRQRAPTMADLVYGTTIGTMLGGLGATANMGNQIGQAADFSNWLSSQNMQAKYGPAYSHASVVDTNRSAERMASQRHDLLAGLLPTILGALGGFATPGGYQTQYGAGTLGSLAKPTNTRKYGAR